MEVRPRVEPAPAKAGDRRPRLSEGHVVSACQRACLETPSTSSISSTSTTPIRKGLPVKITPLLLLPMLTLVSACNFQTNEELKMKQTIADFVSAIQHDDENMATEILLDLAGFRTLNPDVSARVDAGSFTDAVLDDLVSNFRNMEAYFRGKILKVKSFTPGGQWYQYKGFSAFKNSVVVVEADGQDVEFVIRGMVRIGEKWRIVDLSDSGLF